MFVLPSLPMQKSSKMHIRKTIGALMVLAASRDPVRSGSMSLLAIRLKECERWKTGQNLVSWFRYVSLSTGVSSKDHYVVNTGSHPQKPIWFLPGKHIFHLSCRKALWNNFTARLFNLFLFSTNPDDPELAGTESINESAYNPFYVICEVSSALNELGSGSQRTIKPHS